MKPAKTYGIKQVPFHCPMCERHVGNAPSTAGGIFAFCCNTFAVARPDLAKAEAKK
jgi:hypothetical protein